MKIFTTLSIGLLWLAASASAQYQQQATIWTYVEDTFTPDNNLFIESVRYGLACFYFATHAQPNIYTTSPTGWTNTTGWLTFTDHCTWHGITCNDQGIITGIELPDNNVEGMFPQELTLVSAELTVLDLHNNPIASVGGDLSWLSSMKKLRYLDLYYCNMDYYGIPPYFEDMTSLEYLDISYCYFYGELNGTIFTKMQNLTHLNIGGNFFQGQSVPTAIASLPKLERLFLAYSGFVGDLSWITLVNKDIFELWFDDNNFDGSLSSDIGLLTGLASLSMTSCTLTGTIPTEIGLLTRMQQLWFFNNTFIGTIPTEIGDLTELRIFQTEDNLLFGSMPQSICDQRDDEGGNLESLSTDCEAGNADVVCADSCCNCCKSPCFEGGGFAFCFPGSSLVEVADKGIIRMDELKIGDNVRVGEGDFSEVYGFGHYNKNAPTEYLQLHGSGLARPLEITEDHMVFIDERGAVPARNVKIGDNLVLTDGTSTVTKISTVKRTGGFAPFTHSGTIAVDNVLASSYVSLQEGAEYLMAGNIKIAPMHGLAHILQAPRRLMCRVNADMCAKETYNEDGVANWVYYPLLAAQWIVEQNAVVIAAVAVPVLLVAGVFFVVECILMNAGLFALAAAGYVYVTRRGGKKSAASA